MNCHHLYRHIPFIFYNGRPSGLDRSSSGHRRDPIADLAQSHCHLRRQRASAPPTEAVKLIFIHHSTGQNWLADGNGGLGQELGENNYFVSDTNYGWGPDAIGDRTDIGNWWEWFRGPESGSYLSALYNESGQHSSYSRSSTDPGGENQVIMFKSCFPNSQLGGGLDDPVPAIDDNPLKGVVLRLPVSHRRQRQGDLHRPVGVFQDQAGQAVRGHRHPAGAGPRTERERPGPEPMAGERLAGWLSV